MKTTKVLAAALFAAALLAGCAANEVGMEKGEKKAGCCSDGSAKDKSACCTTDAGSCADGAAKAEGQCCGSDKAKQQ